MQWLTAILAFATTMLIFSIVVSTLVETIHRLLKSRPKGLDEMLGRFFDEVIKPYGEKTEAGKQIGQNSFVSEMTRMRGTAPSVSGGTTQEKWAWNPTLMTDLPAESFMERLGTSGFSAVLDEKFADKSEDEDREKALRDIGQKFELYGHEAGIYFERKARRLSVIVALFVAWIFYVHPYDLIRTYMQQPEVAAAVAELHEEALHKYDALQQKADEVFSAADTVAVPSEKSKAEDAAGDVAEGDATPEQVEHGVAPDVLASDDGREAGGAEPVQREQQEVADALASVDEGKTDDAKPVDSTEFDKEELNLALQEFRDDLEEAREELKPLEAAGAPIGWSDEKGKCVYPRESQPGAKVDEETCLIYKPKKYRDYVWLLLGGLLVGLGAPFWAKAVRQITQIQTVSKNVAGILKPARQAQANQGQSATTTDESSVPEEAFKAAAVGPKTLSAAPKPTTP